MAHLLLVKHSLPEILPGVPASHWHLSPEGMMRCKPLANQLVHFHPKLIFSSPEPKALQTSQVLADELGLSIEIHPLLHEHRRETVAFEDRAGFEERIANFFARPHDLVFGEETAHEAQARFSQAVRAVLAERQTETTIIVAHGTVITLFVVQVSQENPFSLWKRLGLPSLVVLALPELALVEVMEAFI